jgi:hypothetical protein
MFTERNAMKAALLYLFAASAWAQTLTPVSAPTAGGVPIWAWIAGGALLILIGYLVLKRKSPTTAAAVSTTVSADAHHVTSALSVEFGKLRDMIERKAAPVPVAPVDLSSAADVPAVPAAPAGKQGVAGVFSLTVTGDAKVDLPALTAAYLG